MMKPEYDGNLLHLAKDWWWGATDSMRFIVDKDARLSPRSVLDNIIVGFFRSSTRKLHHSKSWLRSHRVL